MYRTISRSSSGLIRQSTKTHQTVIHYQNYTKPIQLEITTWSLGNRCLSFGYFSQQSSLIQNASTAENIEKVFEEGNAGQRRKNHWMQDKKK